MEKKKIKDNSKSLKKINLPEIFSKYSSMFDDNIILERDDQSFPKISKKYFTEDKISISNLSKIEPNSTRNSHIPNNLKKKFSKKLLIETTTDHFFKKTMQEDKKFGQPYDFTLNTNNFEKKKCIRFQKYFFKMKKN